MLYCNQHFICLRVDICTSINLLFFVSCTCVLMAGSVVTIKDDAIRVLKHLCNDYHVVKYIFHCNFSRN